MWVHNDRRQCRVHENRLAEMSRRDNDNRFARGTAEEGENENPSERWYALSQGDILRHISTNEDEQEAGTGDVRSVPEEFRGMDETADRTMTAPCMFARAADKEGLE